MRRREASIDRLGSLTPAFRRVNRSPHGREHQVHAPVSAEPASARVQVAATGTASVLMSPSRHAQN
jgi:Flp pilus assembly protein CpaB